MKTVKKENHHGGDRIPPVPKNTNPAAPQGSKSCKTSSSQGERYQKRGELPLDIALPRDLLCSPPARRKRTRDRGVDVLHLDDVRPRYGKRCKVGDHSVNLVGVSSQLAVLSSDISAWTTGPDLLGSVFETFHTEPTGFIWQPDLHHFQASTNVQLAQSRDRALVFAVPQMAVSVEAPPYRRIDYTRVVWRQAQLQGSADLSSLRASGAVTDAINPRELNQKIGSLLPWVRQLVESLAFIANDGRGIYNNAALYMKGLVLVMTQDRMVLSNIPVPLPDLHLAPVTFMRIENTTQYAPQYQVIRDACESGDFVFVEGYGWTRDDVVNTCYLALGGAPFAAIDQDHAIPTQSLRWPRIPILVLLTGPMPEVPQQAPFQAESFMVFLRNMATSRSEEADLAQGWYDATLLQGSEWITNLNPMFQEGAEPAHAMAFGPNMPGPHHHLHDNADGDLGFFQVDLPPLQQPDPMLRAQDVLNRELAAFQAAFGQWAERQRRHHERLMAARPAQGRGRGEAAAAAVIEPPDLSREAYIRAGHPEPELQPPPPGTFRHQPLDPLPVPPVVRGGRPRGQPPPENPRYNRIHYDEWFLRHAVWRLLTPLWECNARLEYPRPMDTNFTLRLGGYVSKHLCTQNVFPLRTCPILTTANRVPTFTRLAHWFGALIFSASTSIFWSYNMTGQVLQAISDHLNLNRYFAELVYSSGLFRRNTSGTLDGYPLLMALIGQWVKENTGCTISPWLFGMRSWACNDVVPPQGALVWLTANYPTHTPRRGTLLSLLRWLKTIPREWSLTKPGVTVDFTREFLIWDGPAATRGWYPEAADFNYTNSAKSESPYMAIEYGAAAFNVMAQLVPGPNPLVEFQQRGQLVQRQVPNLPIAAPAPYPAGRGAPVFNQVLRCIEPCTLLNYDWITNLVMIPWLQQAYFPDGISSWLARTSGAVEGVGITYDSTSEVPQLAPIGDRLPGMLGALALARQGRQEAGANDAGRARAQEAVLGLNQPRVDAAIDPPAPHVLPNVVPPDGLVQPPAHPNDGAEN
ncbi:MAG: hypothetical protein SNCTV1_gp1 [Sanya nephotettix cincticeps totivirus 2]|nr:MAG: hypothetical protein SNCTV1_gp1 [Sanya nephotettix cincticeps totivirus 2]